MPRRRKVHRAEFKAKVALAAIQGDKSVQQLGAVFDVHPNQVQLWKKQLLLGAVGLFETRDQSQELAAQQAREAELFEQIGRLNMEGSGFATGPVSNGGPGNPSVSRPRLLQRHRRALRVSPARSGLRST
jgi:transposase